MKKKFSKISQPGFITDQDWNSWQWQMRNSLRSKEDFEKWFDLTSEEKKVFEVSAVDGVNGKAPALFNIRTTQYYANLAKNCVPIRKMMVPTILEYEMGAQAQLDPLDERKNNPVSRVIHRYPDRALFLVTDTCAVFCRYCTRKHFTGQEQALVKEEDYSHAIDYFKSHKGIREIILSGGDPLTLSDQQIFRILKDLRKIEHIEIIRIGTRMPVTCPMRMTEELAVGLREYAPVFIMTHFNHPQELTEQSNRGISLLVDHGVPVMNQMVLLNGVNNHAAIVQALCRRLLYLRVKPYYMFQCDPSVGTDHLRISIEESEKIQHELWGNLSGLAMPSLSLDIPSGGGKVGLVPNFEISHDESGRVYKGFDGVVEKYVNPTGPSLVPADLQLYLKEWDELKTGKFHQQPANTSQVERTSQQIS